ncbi:Nba1p SCDLUD_005058 [Saccharomycodes ludwigii]|uniref:Nba1p n=1 Tax=Saccharomycodes ludwigii TaxID=36035 RepID=UPI001E8A9753|nr:hypothetical protein SCDLUD_005058 [Saccharomycodes ludwigii]KAH3898731.1 hypothetical protein SCDLUD_005058 [Saccharomycodes ludwigii]
MTTNNSHNIQRLSAILDSYVMPEETENETQTSDLQELVNSRASLNHNEAASIQSSYNASIHERIPVVSYVLGSNSNSEASLIKEEKEDKIKELSTDNAVKDSLQSLDTKKIKNIDNIRNSNKIFNTLDGSVDVNRINESTTYHKDVTDSDLEGKAKQFGRATSFRLSVNNKHAPTSSSVGSGNLASCSDYAYSIHTPKISQHSFSSNYTNPQSPPTIMSAVQQQQQQHQHQHQKQQYSHQRYDSFGNKNIRREPTILSNASSEIPELEVKVGSNTVIRPDRTITNELKPSIPPRSRNRPNSQIFAINTVAEEENCNYEVKTEAKDNEQFLEQQVNIKQVHEKKPILSQLELQLNDQLDHLQKFTQANDSTRTIDSCAIKKEPGKVIEDEMVIKKENSNISQDVKAHKNITSNNLSNLKVDDDDYYSASSNFVDEFGVPVSNNSENGFDDSYLSRPLPNIPDKLLALPKKKNTRNTIKLENADINVLSHDKILNESPKKRLSIDKFKKGKLEMKNNDQIKKELLPSSPLTLEKTKSQTLSTTNQNKEPQIQVKNERAVSNVSSKTITIPTVSMKKEVKNTIDFFYQSDDNLAEKENKKSSKTNTPSPVKKENRTERLQTKVKQEEIIVVDVDDDENGAYDVKVYDDISKKEENGVSEQQKSKNTRKQSPYIKTNNDSSSNDGNTSSYKNSRSASEIGGAKYNSSSRRRSQPSSIGGNNNGNSNTPKKKEVRSSFDIDTISQLLNVTKGTLIGSEFANLGMKVEEKRALERLVDSLSRLTADMILDPDRYEEGIKRLNKAIKALEGF